MKRIVSWMILLLLLIGTLALAFGVGLVHAQAETVYINSDGSVSPSSAPISTIDNVTYTLTGDISYPAYDGIVVERNNIVVNGNGYTVQGRGDYAPPGSGFVSYAGDGLLLYDISNVTIENANIEGFYHGIYLNSSSSNNTVSGNDVIQNNFGICLNSSSNNIVNGNNATVSYSGDIVLDSSSNNIVSGNDATESGGGAGIQLYDFSNDNIFDSNYASVNTGPGIFFSASSNNNTVSDNDVRDDYVGIWLDSSSNNTLNSNNVTANSIGIYLTDSSNTTVTENNATINGDEGIYLLYSSNNIVSANNATANSNIGIYLNSSSNNAICGNNAIANSEGIYLWDSSDNAIYHNNFINNTSHFYNFNSTNTWDDGYPSGGNYWSDYQTKYPNATEIDGSGIWNTPYVIDANNTDNYPLMTPVTIVPEFPSFLVLTLFMMATLLAVIIYQKKALKIMRL